MEEDCNSKANLEEKEDEERVDHFQDKESKPPTPPIRNYYDPMRQGIGERAIRHVLKTCYFDRPAIDYLIRNARIHSVRRFMSMTIKPVDIRSCTN